MDQCSCRFTSVGLVVRRRFRICLDRRRDDDGPLGLEQPVRLGPGAFRGTLIAGCTVHAGQRIDNFLLRVLKDVPKSRVYRMLRKGEVRVNRSRVPPDYRLADGDSVRLPPLRRPRVSTAPIAVRCWLS